MFKLTKINWEDGNNSKCKNKVFLWSYKTRAKLSLLNRVKDNCKIISTDNDSIYSIWIKHVFILCFEGTVNYSKDFNMYATMSWY